MKVFKGLLLTLFFALLLGGFVAFLLLSQPRNPSGRSFEPVDTDTLTESVIQDLERYQDMLLNEELTEEQLTEILSFIQDVRIYYQRGQIVISDLRQRLESLERQHATLATEEELLRSREVEQAGLRAWEERRTEEAVEYLTEAANIQRAINRTYDVSPPVDRARLSRLDNYISTVRAFEKDTKSRAIEEEAQAAMENRDYREAADLFRQAMNLQLKINAEFFNTTYSSVQRANQLRDEATLAESAILFEGVERHVRRARDSMEQGNRVAARRAFDEAEREMVGLIERYPANPFATRARLAELAFLRDNVLAEPEADVLLEDLNLLQTSLRTANFQLAREGAVNLRGRIEQFISQYPNHGMINDMVLQRVRYLTAIGDNLPRIYGELVEGVSPQPDSSGFLWYATEIPQQLYQLIMLENPSRERGSMLPVTRITNDQAEEFCSRASTILGRQVRLPTVEEYARVIGEGGASPGWIEGTAGGRVHQVRTSEPTSTGLYDLLGNVAEWTQRLDRQSNEVPVVGGDIHSRPDQFDPFPFRLMGINQRSDTVGFRFVVVDSADWQVSP